MHLIFGTTGINTIDTNQNSKESSFIHRDLIELETKQWYNIFQL